MAVIAFDAERQAILIEGLHYRYTVFFDDLIDIQDVAGGNQLGTKISYRVGDVPLAIVVSRQDSVRHELRKQTIGVKKAPLSDAIRRTLGVME